MDVLHEAFMDSPPHRQNELNREYRHVGVGMRVALRLEAPAARTRQERPGCRTSALRNVRVRCYCRSDMEGITWAALGILAAGQLGTLFYLGSRIDALAARMDTRFAHVDARLAQVEARFDHVDDRFDQVNARFDSVQERLDAINGRVDAHLERHTG